MSGRGDPMLDRLAAQLEEAGVGVGARLCCAFSGGVDSVVLLELLHRLAPQRGLQLSAAHVHHGLSPNAGQWAAFCADFCAARNIPFQLCRVELGPLVPGQGVEAAAREARYAALDALGADWLVLGHHADDQAETVLLNLLRGAGVRGAAAMAPWLPPRAGRAARWRPLLAVRRHEIEHWAQAQGLNWVDDESNAGLAYRRNQLRLRALPALSESFPAAVPMLARAADNFRAAEGLLGELAALDARACGLEDEGEGGAVMLQREAALALGDERLLNLLRWLASAAGYLPASRQRLHEALRQLRTVAPGRALRVVSGDFACCLYRDWLWLEPAALAQPLVQRWQGEAALPWGQGELRFERRAGGGIALERLQAAAVVALAPPRAGMRLRASVGGPTRSLRKWAQAAAVPSWWRAQLPVLWVDEEPAWLAGFGVCAGFAAKAGESGLWPQWRGTALAGLILNNKQGVSNE